MRPAIDDPAGPGIVHQGSGAVADSSQGTGGVERSRQHGVEIEVFGDAKAGAAQAGEALTQLSHPLVSLVRSVQLVVSTEIGVSGVNCAVFGE